jgi:hypothetical protein
MNHSFIALSLVIAMLCTAFSAGAQIYPSPTKEEQLGELKKQYREGKISLTEYQKASNALVAPPITGFTVSPGTHLMKGGRCLVAGGVFTLIGITAIASSPYMPYNNGNATLAQLAAGGGLAFVGIILDVAGGAQMIRAGRKFNALKIGESASLVVNPGLTAMNISLTF